MTKMFKKIMKFEFYSKNKHLIKLQYSHLKIRKFLKKSILTKKIKNIQISRVLEIYNYIKKNYLKTSII